jgi:hypothetical protein
MVESTNYESQAKDMFRECFAQLFTENNGKAITMAEFEGCLIEKTS